MNPRLSAFLEALKSPRASERRNAGLALAYMPADALLPLIGVLEQGQDLHYDADPRRGTEVAQAIAMSHYPELALPVLLRLLQHGRRPIVRKEAACALRLLGREAAAEAVPALIETLQNAEEAPLVRHDAALALSALDAERGISVPALIEALCDPDPRVCAAAARALGLLSRHAAAVIPALLVKLGQMGEATQGHDVTAVKIHTIVALSKILEIRGYDKTERHASVKRCIHFLKMALEFGDDKTALESIRAFRALVPDSASNPQQSYDLQEAALLALKSANRGVRSEAALLLGLMESQIKNDDVGRIINALSDSVRNDPDGYVRYSALEAVRVIRRPVNAVLPVFLKALEDREEAMVRESAALALEQFGPAAKTAAEALMRHVRDEDENPAVRIRCVFALTRLGISDAGLRLLLFFLLNRDHDELRLVALHVLQRMQQAAGTCSPPFLSTDHVTRFDVQDEKELCQIALTVTDALLPWRQGSPKVRAAATNTLLSLRVPPLRSWTARGGAYDNFLGAMGEIGNNTDDKKSVTVDQRGPLPSPEEFAEQLLAGLPQDQEARLIALAGRLDAHRDAIRQKLQEAVNDYMEDRNPRKKEERQHSIDIINGLMDRLGFALEHPAHPGKQCYLYLYVGKSDPQGQIRLLSRGGGGSSNYLASNARLSHFTGLRVIDALPSLQLSADKQSAAGEISESPSSWLERVAESTPGGQPSRRKN